VGRRVLVVRRLRSLVLPISVYGFEVFQKFDKALCLRVVASAFPFFDILGWRECVFAIGEEIEVLVDSSELAAFLNDGEVSELLHQDVSGNLGLYLKNHNTEFKAGGKVLLNTYQECFSRQMRIRAIKSMKQ
jgi:hypothetical protein